MVRREPSRRMCSGGHQGSSTVSRTLGTVGDAEEVGVMLAWERHEDMELTVSSTTVVD